MDECLKVQAHFKKVDKNINCNQVRNIDQIYLINLDKREQRLKRCQNEFERFGVFLQRFSAVHGWELTQKTFNEISMRVLPSTTFDSLVHFGPVAGHVPPHYLDPSHVGKHCVHHTMAAGALGCYLSHLSILADAFDAGYQTVWILEDDITVTEDPHRMADYIDLLDSLVGSSEWDILYTDHDDHFISTTMRAHMGGSPGNLGRPGIPMTDKLLECRAIGSDFYKIGGRTQAHSYIIRHSGIAKILDYIIVEGIFRPYDIELAFIPDLKFYNLSHDAVHGRDRTFSDTFYQIK